MVSEITAQFIASICMITGILSGVIPILFFILGPDLLQSTANREAERFASGITTTYLMTIPENIFGIFKSRLDETKSQLISEEKLKEEDERVNSNKKLRDYIIIMASIIFAIFGTIAFILYKFVGFPLVPFLTKVVFVCLSAIMIEVLFLYYIVGEIMPVNMNAINKTVVEYAIDRANEVIQYLKSSQVTSTPRPNTTGVNFV